MIYNIQFFGGRGASVAQKATNARNIENMNEEQLAKAIIMQKG